MFGERYVNQKVDVDLDALKKIANKTSGSFFAAQDTQSLQQIYDMIDNLEKTKVEVRKWVEYKEFYPALVLSSLILMAFYILLSNTRFLRIP